MPEKLRGMYSVDPGDEEYKNVTKNARRKLKTPQNSVRPS